MSYQIIKLSVVGTTAALIEIPLLRFVLPSLRAFYSIHAIGVNRVPRCHL